MARIAIVGAGIAGITAAFALVRAGHRVDLFENGGEVPYPHAPQFAAEFVFADLEPGIVPALANDLKRVAVSGDYGGDLDDEQIMCVGGQATRWFGIAPRFREESFRPFSLHGFGSDWPISYADLEPYYRDAEIHLGISGSNTDNPFAAPRSTPFPLPPFELSWEDLRLAERMKTHGLAVHSTPQARVREDYDDRIACQNYGACDTCPVGARYSPNHHLEMFRTVPSFTLHTRCSVRRIVTERGRARGLVYHRDHELKESEHAADVVIVAAGGLETARLLLLSPSASGGGDGLGNASGQVGRNLGFHHVWWGRMQFPHSVMPGRAGPPTMLSHQFTEAEDGHGGFQVEMFDRPAGGLLQQLAQQRFQSGAEVVEALRPILTRRPIGFHAETRPSERKAAYLSGLRDRFDDPFIEVRYELDDFDHATFEAVRETASRLSSAAGAQAHGPNDILRFWSGNHHLGTCRMGASPDTSVVDSFGAIHGVPNAYICGGSTFVTVTAFQPTLTIAALTMRTADRVIEELR